MKQFIKKTALLSIIFATMFACKPNEPEVFFCDVTIEVDFPEEFADNKSDVVIQWENITNKTNGEVKTDNNGKATIKVEYGNYNFYASKKVDAVFCQGRADNYAINKDIANVEIKLSASYVSTSWVIKEVYFSGSRTPAEKAYLRDQYVEIYNNSNETLYADGLIFCKTYDKTSNKVENWKTFKDNNVVVPFFIFQVPGTGKEHPIEPGKSLLLADQGLNHKEKNENSPVDLSNADFECYDEHKLDVDVPEVPNLLKLFSASPTTMSVLFSGGAEGYCILQMPVAKTQEFLDAHPATTKNAAGKDLNSYAIPAKYIIDAVQVAQPTGYNFTVLPSTLDGGYTFCDKNFSGKCVQRKFDKEENGRAILKDTNNSTNDFTPNATPSPREVVR